jgi:hypothetical protein
MSGGESNTMKSVRTKGRHEGLSDRRDCMIYDSSNATNPKSR